MKNKDKKILFINKDGFLGGSAVSLLLLLKCLKRKSCDFEVILCQSGPLEQELRKINVKYHIIKFSEWRKLIKIFKNLFAIFKLRKYIKKNHFDIIHSNSYEVNPLAVFSKANELKTICHLRDVIDSRRAKKFFLQKSDLIITVSNFCKEKIRNINKNIKVIYNGVDLKNLKAKKVTGIVTGKKFKVGIIGNCEPRKAQDTFINAAIEILKRQKNFIFYILGANQTKYCKKLQAKINEYKEHFEFLPFQNNIFDYINSIDIVIISSRSEAFGRTAIEAMALKKVVIASNVGGLKEIIKHNKNGLLFPVNDYIKLAKYILMLENDKEKYEKLSINGYNTMNDRFTLEIYCKKIIGEYKKL